MAHDEVPLRKPSAGVVPTRHGAFDRGQRFWRQLARRARDRTTVAFVLDGPEGVVRISARTHGHTVVNEGATVGVSVTGSVRFYPPAG